MTTLTNRERDGLDDVFLSIHSNSDKYKKIRVFTSIIITSDISIACSKVLKHAKIGLKKAKNLHILSLFTKKKNSLSK